MYIKKFMTGIIPYIILLTDILLNYIKKKMAAAAFRILGIYLVTTLVFYLFAGFILSLYIKTVFDKKIIIIINLIILTMIMFIPFLKQPTFYGSGLTFNVIHVLLIGVHLYPFFGGFN